MFSQIVDLYIYFGVNVFDSSFRSRENVLILNSFDGIDWFYLKSWFDRIFVSIIKSIPGARKLNPLRVSPAILKPERRRRSNPAARLRICPSKLDPEPGPVDYGLRTTDYGLRTTDYGLRTSTTDYGLRTSTTEYGLRTTDYGLRTTDNWMHDRDRDVSLTVSPAGTLPGDTTIMWTIPCPFVRTMILVQCYVKLCGADQGVWLGDSTLHWKGGVLFGDPKQSSTLEKNIIIYIFL